MARTPPYRTLACPDIRWSFLEHISPKSCPFLELYYGHAGMGTSMFLHEKQHWLFSGMAGHSEDGGYLAWVLNSVEDIASLREKLVNNTPHASFQPFYKYVVTAYYVPGTALDAGDTLEHQSRPRPHTEFTDQQGRKILRKTRNQMWPTWLVLCRKDTGGHGRVILPSQRGYPKEVF